MFVGLKLIPIECMKVFASWSGGKDCMFAVYREIIKQENEVVCLVNMCEADGVYSRTHGLKRQLIANQAAAMNIPILQEFVGEEGYERSFKEAINQLKKQGVTGGIFGDIYLQEHRDWIERVCTEMAITPIFPLWKEETSNLLKEFINLGFKAFTVAINTQKLDEKWLNRELDESFYTEIIQLEDIDPCAEKGEYHTFVYDGPIFEKPVTFNKGDVYQKGKDAFIRLEV